MTRELTFEERIIKKRSEVAANLPHLSGESRQASIKRLGYLEHLVHDERRENRLRTPKIFLSFAGDAGEDLIQDVFPALRKLQVPNSDRTFKVETGMSATGKPQVMDHIVSKVEKCCIFFGILTREHKIGHADDEGGSHAPGAWVVLEAGMAIGLDLRVVFFVEQGVHKGFWQGPMGSWRHARFERSSYRSGLRVATGLVLEHYKELLETIT